MLRSYWTDGSSEPDVLSLSASQILWNTPILWKTVITILLNYMGMCIGIVVVVNGPAETSSDSKVIWAVCDLIYKYIMFQPYTTTSLSAGRAHELTYYPCPLFFNPQSAFRCLVWHFQTASVPDWNMCRNEGVGQTGHDSILKVHTSLHKQQQQHPQSSREKDFFKHATKACQLQTWRNVVNEFHCCR